MIENLELLGPATSTLIGGGVAAILTKMALTKWFKNIEKDSETLREVEKTLAVIQHRVEKMEKDINGIGAALRKMASPQ